MDYGATVMHGGSSAQVPEPEACGKPALPRPGPHTGLCSPLVQDPGERTPHPSLLSWVPRAASLDIFWSQWESWGWERLAGTKSLVTERVGTWMVTETYCWRILKQLAVVTRASFKECDLRFPAVLCSNVHK